jgi:hypothetical protein
MYLCIVWFDDVLLNDQHDFGKFAPDDWMIPTMTPNKPKAEPKISITRIFTNVSGVWASEIAHPEPVIPTAILIAQP